MGLVGPDPAWRRPPIPSGGPRPGPHPGGRRGIEVIGR
ncbi:MAG: hypothetical protein AVDCRST_MAG88-436 [uncultured Thermomicrobiales bacterium]|uniref:Uncharacterized protein n=1 Tax=uncultured Thermomicrobiales bacterium TaxID=1645740 RepID=A0A6J4UEM9_9BACT|nr:MAG: hypothetical protein AVDCRST_MAG88-436 [uncultured Thermomicrobiales bacterium]